jgi:hypothetical protein
MSNGDLFILFTSYCFLSNNKISDGPKEIVRSVSIIFNRAKISNLNFSHSLMRTLPKKKKKKNQ